MVPGPYTSCMPTEASASLRRCKGCLREHADAYVGRCSVQACYSKCTLAAPARKWQLFSMSVVLAAPALRSSLQCKLEPHICPRIAARTYSRCLESLRECLRNDLNEGKRSKLCKAWQTALSHGWLKHLREKPTRGVAQQPTADAQKPTRSHAANQNGLRKVHARRKPRFV